MKPANLGWLVGRVQTLIEQVNAYSDDPMSASAPGECFRLVVNNVEKCVRREGFADFDAFCDAVAERTSIEWVNRNLDF